MLSRMIMPLLIGLLGVAVLAGLGVWQLQRLDWKEGVLAAMQAQLDAPPVALPAAPDPVADRYRAVTVTGRFTGDELHVLSGSREGPGFLIVAAFQTDDGRRIMVDRGFVPETGRNAPRPPQGALTVTGNLNWPDDMTSTTPAPDLAANIWYGRDVAPMAAALTTEPLMVIAREPTGQGITPRPADTGAVRNDHFGYAVTWFGLAAVWAGMTIYWLWRIRRRSA
jgi:surfeit locus 1 family protein